MDLASYISTENTVLILLPRFTSTEPFDRILGDYMAAKSYTVSKVDSKVIHSYQNAEGKNVLIFDSLLAYQEHRIKNKDSIDLILVEWGFDVKMFEGILRDPKMKVKLLKIGFVKDPHAVAFKRVDVEMGSVMSQWYREITEGEYSQKIKSMVGNYFFDEATADELIGTLTQGNKFSSVLSSGNDENFEFQLANPINPEGSEGFQGNLNGYVGSPNGPSGLNGSTASLDRLKDNSPKLYDIITSIVKNPGKYLIVTSHVYTYGARFFRYILERVFGAAPHVLDPGTENPHEVIEKFNSSKYSILITSVVPEEFLTGISATIIMDTYSVPFIVAILKKICSYGCGYFGGVGGKTLNPMPFTLLTVKYMGEDVSYEIREAEGAKTILKEMDTAYTKASAIASEIHIRDSLLVVEKKV